MDTKADTLHSALNSYIGTCVLSSLLESKFEWKLITNLNQGVLFTYNVSISFKASKMLKNCSMSKWTREVDLDDDVMPGLR